MATDTIEAVRQIERDGERGRESGAAVRQQDSRTGWMNK